MNMSSATLPRNF